MKVFFYITSLAMGGAEQQCSRIAAALKSIYGYDVEMIVSYPNLSNERLRLPLKAREIPIHGFSWKTLGGCRGIMHVLRSGGPGSVLFCFNTFPDFWGGVLGRLAGVKKIFGGIRSEYLPWPHILMDWMAQRLFLSGTIFNSYRARDKFVKRFMFSARLSKTISNSIPESNWRHDYTKENDGISVITVGTFKPPKDYYTWLKVLNIAHGLDSCIQGTIIGYGWQKPYLQRWIKELALEGVVELVDGKDIEDIPNRLARADIYLSTSTLEGTSNAIMEGLRAGLPVVATDVGDNRYLIQDGRSGYICPVKDSNALASAVLCLSHDSEKRRRFGLCAMQRMRENHSIERIAIEYKKLIMDEIHED